MAEKITRYDEFWLFYLREHARPRTRHLHYGGTILALAAVAGAVILGKPKLAALALVVGYGPAWIAHFFVEKNRPATFTYPIWSLISDFRMAYLWGTAQLDRELTRAGVPPETNSVSIHQR